MHAGYIHAAVACEAHKENYIVQTVYTLEFLFIKSAINNSICMPV